jgi:FdhD protein
MTGRLESMGRASTRRRITRITVGAEPVTRADTLAGEEPLEIRVNGTPLAVTMRTPGADMDLAVGFLVSEGVLGDAAGVTSMRYCAGAAGDGTQTYNVLDVVLAPDVPAPDPSLARAFYTTSSCGLCGKASIDGVRTRTRHPVAADPVTVPADVLAGLPDRVREAQAIFATTGGLHAAALLDVASDKVVVVREDVGRHNAVDKVVGAAARDARLPLAGTVLFVSGRASFELTQKALMAGIPVLAAVSAPSSLAVDLAVDGGLTLVAFLRGASMNVYAGAHRVDARFAAEVARGS